MTERDHPFPVAKKWRDGTPISDEDGSAPDHKALRSHAANPDFEPHSLKGVADLIVQTDEDLQARRKEWSA